MTGESTALPRWYHCETNVGRHREMNEDSHAEYALGDGAVLLVVADGMGGHEAGEVASRIAVDAIGHIVQNSPATDPREKLRNGFLVANQRILATAQTSGTPGMGTTAVAAYVRGAETYVAHVGDSRLYHVRKGTVLYRTLDHTRVQKMISMGILAAADAKQHPDANVVTRALGYARLADGSTLEPEVGQTPLTLVAGDSLVLCSDGLYDDVEDAELAQLLAGRSAPEAAQALVALANERGGHDNITVTVLHYGAEQGAPPLKAPAGPARSSRRPLLSTLAAVGGLALAALALGFYVHTRGASREIHAPDMAAAKASAVAIAVPSLAAAAPDAGSSKNAAPSSSNKQPAAAHPNAPDPPHPAKVPVPGKNAPPAKPMPVLQKTKGDPKASVVLPRQQAEPTVSPSLSIASATWDGTPTT